MFKSQVSFLVFRLVNDTDLKVGDIRAIFMEAGPNSMGPIWNLQRSEEQWASMADKRIYALAPNASIEFIPPTKGVPEKFAAVLMQLAEKHQQLPNDHVTGLICQFEQFVAGLERLCPVVSFEEFQNSTIFDNYFKENTPTENVPQEQDDPEDYDDSLDMYDDAELSKKRLRFG